MNSEKEKATLSKEEKNRHRESVIWDSFKTEVGKILAKLVVISILLLIIMYFDNKYSIFELLIDVDKMRIIFEVIEALK